MKKVVSLILEFFLSFLISLLLLAFVYMLHESCSLLCAGQTTKIFIFQPFLKGLIEIAPFAGILALLSSFQVLVRRRWRTVSSACCMLGLFAVVFAVVIPVSFNLKMDFYELSQEKNLAIKELRKDVVQTPGYFRTTKDGVYYFTAIDHNYTASGVYSPSTATEKKVFETFKHKNFQFDEEEISADLLIKNELALPFYLDWPIKALASLSDCFYKAYNQGWLPYLCLASIVLAFFALWGVSFISSWPLLSVFMMILAFVIVLVSNYFALCTEVFAPAKMFISELFSAESAGLVMPLMLNVLLLLLGSIGGLIAHLLRRKRNLGADL